MIALLAMVASGAAVGAPAASAGITPITAAPRAGSAGDSGSAAMAPGRGIGIESSERMRKSGTNLCLVVRATGGEVPVVQYNCGSFADQQFNFFYPHDPDATYVKFYGSLTGLCVAARGTGRSGAVATSCGPWIDQEWSWNYNATFGGYQYRNRNSGLCLAVQGTAMNTQAIQTTCGNWSDQHWVRA
ncbi:RICIN domain-containing protein [Micromonospora rifamycinica]|uniref:RICIN domain-containing protein n=1 Tax=Micromonospora rifamycinica TaxID=291594 RepID=UPI0033FDD3AF